MKKKKRSFYLTKHERSKSSRKVKQVIGDIKLWISSCKWYSGQQ